MLRATSGQISRNALQRNLRQPSGTREATFLPFLYPSCTGISKWTNYSIGSTLQSSSGEKAPKIETKNYSTVVERQSAGKYHNASGDLIILDSPKLPNEIPRKFKLFNGISKGRDEVLATYEACVRIGRIGRARLMLDEISKQLSKETSLLYNAHNTYLHALLKRNMADNSEESLRAFFSWYEDTMKRKLNMNGDPTTYALLLKGSLRDADTLHGQRYTRKYISEWIDSGRPVKEVLENPLIETDEVISIGKTCGLKPAEVGERHIVRYVEEDAVEVPKILSVPEPIPSVVKGLSLASVKQSLRSLTDPDAMPNQYAFGQDDLAFQVARQKLLEDDAFTSAQEVWKRDAENMAQLGMVQVSSSVNSMLWSWHQAMIPLIRQEMARVALAEESRKEVNSIDRCLYGPFLHLMTPEKIAAITILELVKLQNSASSEGGVKSSQAVMAVGSILEQEYFAEEITKKKNKDLFGNLPKEQLQMLFDNRRLLRSKIKHTRIKADEEPQANLGLQIHWPNNIKAKLGAVLISMLLHCAKITVAKKDANGKTIKQLHPAIWHGYRFIKGRKMGVIKFHPELINQLAREPLRRGCFGRLLPMLVPPRPWMASEDGGYYYTFSKVMRTKNNREQEIYIRAASDRGDLEKVFEGLDVLGQTAWGINEKVFNIILKVWNEGEQFAEIPPRDSTSDLPDEPAPSEGPLKRAQWLNGIRRLKANERNSHSMRCDLNLKLEIARAFLYEKFYMPHNVDFRGRAYPIPPNLNHVGSDFSRGLLQFGKGKELGENGLKWLKIHLANLVGFDKASFPTRVEYVDQHMEEIKDSAENPLDGNKWWLKSEDPWQTLASCMAVNDAMSMEDPSKYVCYLPVAQDGTCNGLQHYAALGGDTVGAKQVNLEPSEKPQDVYSGVAALVNAQVEKDAAEGNEIALLLRGHITRKVVKQPVMTNVYGVTFIGARQQIQNRLDENPAIPRELSVKCASYLAKRVFNSISTIFGGATKIQHWLARTARMIAKSAGPTQFGQLDDHDNGTLVEANDPRTRSKGKMEFMTSVVWTTPLGMPIVQPYRKHQQQVVATNLQKISILDPSSIDQVNAKKQSTAFPPNFIHSLDANHMLMSASKCADNGIDFASVHDSFWTHPSDVDVLNRILREAFIKMHSQDIMEKLKSEFETRYKGFKYMISIKAKSQLAIRIKDARKAYVKELRERKPESSGPLTVVEDLQWELERDRLLASEDPKLRQKGESMITASVLFNEAGGQAGLVEEEEDLDVPELGSQKGADAPSRARAPIEANDIFDDETEESDMAGFAEEEEEEGEEDIVGEDIMEEEEASVEPAATKPKKEVKRERVIHLWINLVIPELPPKGEFDVARLKDSLYFFS